MIELEKMMGQPFSLISTSAHKQKYSVDFLGSFRNQALLVSRPEGLGGEGVIRVGQCFHLRTNQKNIIYNWRTRIVRLCSEPYLCLQLVQSQRVRPQKNETRSGEREARVRVGCEEIHISLQGEKGDAAITVADISLSGARLMSYARLGDIGDVLTISLSVSHGESRICLPCKICYVRSDLALSLPSNEKTYHHGVEFMDLSLANETLLMRLGTMRG